jgi:hypothetical protein
MLNLGLDNPVEGTLNIPWFCLRMDIRTRDVVAISEKLCQASESTAILPEIK